MMQRLGLRQSVVPFVVSVFYLLGLHAGPLLADADTKNVQKADWGELKLTGKYIQKIVLINTYNGKKEVFDQPGERVKLPAGKYQIREVLLVSGGSICEARDLQRRITIDANKTAVSNIGGPLKQTINVQRRGEFLILNYKLRDGDGENYIVKYKAAKFDIYKGDSKIVSGSFRYG